jgi:hypothetical protein
MEFLELIKRPELMDRRAALPVPGLACVDD